MQYFHLIAIPAHHVKDVEDFIGVTVDTVQDGVTVSNPTSYKNEEIPFKIHTPRLRSKLNKLLDSSMLPAPLASVATRQVTGEGLDLFATFTVHLNMTSLQFFIHSVISFSFHLFYYHFF